MEKKAKVALFCVRSMCVCLMHQLMMRRQLNVCVRADGKSVRAQKEATGTKQQWKKSLPERIFTWAQVEIIRKTGKIVALPERARCVRPKVGANVELSGENKKKKSRENEIGLNWVQFGLCVCSAKLTTHNARFFLSPPAARASFFSFSLFFLLLLLLFGCQWTELAFFLLSWARNKCEWIERERETSAMVQLKQATRA